MLTRCNSIQASGIVSFFRVLFVRKEQRRLLPHLKKHRVTEIPFRDLHGCGIRAVIFDKDNTLTKPYVLAFPADIEATVRECQDLFGKERVVIFSNSVGSSDDRGALEAEAIQRELGIDVVRHEQKKPRGFSEVANMWPDLNPESILVVGDRFLTDIYGGNLFGMCTAHVDIITEQGDNLGAKLVGGDEGMRGGERRRG